MNQAPYSDIYINTVPLPCVDAPQAQPVCHDIPLSSAPQRTSASPETAKSVTPENSPAPETKAGELGNDATGLLPAFACLSCPLQRKRLHFDNTWRDQRLLHTVRHLCAGMAQSAGV